MTDQVAAEPAPSTFETIGARCLRAAGVAMAMGLVEAGLAAHRMPAPFGPTVGALAGLWVPGALLAVELGRQVNVRLPSAWLRPAAYGALAVSVISALVLITRSGRVGWGWSLLVEVPGGLLLGASSMRLAVPPAARRWTALAALILVLGLQFAANRWLVAHPAFAGELAETAGWPRLMLKLLLGRFA